MNDSSDVAGISYISEVKRKLVHLSSLWIPGVMVLLTEYRWWLCAMFGVVFAATVLVERWYARWPDAWISRIYGHFFGRMVRGGTPAPNQWIVSGGPYVLAGAFLVLLCFPVALAACGMTVMLIGDTAAALIGRRFGRHKTVNGKSLEGVAAFILSGSLACVVCSWLLAMPARIGWFIPVAVTFAAIAELFEKQLRIDDNISIPLVTAGVLYTAEMLILV